MDRTADWIFELGHLKRVPRSGWSLVGVERPESVADHTYRTALIAYALAVELGADAERAALLALLHDTAEARVGDPHRLARRYLSWDGVQEAVEADQIRGLPATLGQRLAEGLGELRQRDSLEAKVVKDADRLECLFQALEYRASGHSVDEWIASSRAELHTEAARKLAQAALEAPPDRWRAPPDSGGA